MAHAKYAGRHIFSYDVDLRLKFLAGEPASQRASEPAHTAHVGSCGRAGHRQKTKRWHPPKKTRAHGGVRRQSAAYTRSWCSAWTGYYRAAFCALTSGYRRQPHHRRLVWRRFATADLPVALADRWYRALLVYYLKSARGVGFRAQSCKQRRNTLGVDTPFVRIYFLDR